MVGKSTRVGIRARDADERVHVSDNSRSMEEHGGAAAAGAPRGAVRRTGAADGAAAGRARPAAAAPRRATWRGALRAQHVGRAAAAAQHAAAAAAAGGAHGCADGATHGGAAAGAAAAARSAVGVVGVSEGGGLSRGWGGATGAEERQRGLLYGSCDGSSELWSYLPSSGYSRLQRVPKHYYESSLAMHRVGGVGMPFRDAPVPPA